MKLKNFSEFLKNSKLKSIAEETAPFVDKEMEKVQDTNNIEEILAAFNKGHSAATSYLLFGVLNEYHEWIQAQIENQ